MAQTLKPYPEYAAAGLPWLGEIPVHWEVRRGKYLLYEVISRSPEGSEQLLSVSQYTGVTARLTLEGEGGTLTRAESLVGYKQVLPDDLAVNIMLAWNGSLGVAPCAGIVSPAYCVYRFRPNAHPRYFHHLLRTPLYKGRIRTVSTGIVESRLRLYSDDLFGIELLLPAKDEQIAIARFLDHMDHRIRRFIRAKRRLIELLNEQKQAIIHRAVTRGLDPHVCLKPSGVDWLGDVPEHWEVRRLRSLAKFVTSGSRGWAQYYSDEGPVFLRIGNISTESVDLKLGDIQRVRPPAGSEGERTRVEPDDVLVSITALMGAVGIVPQDLGEAYVNQHTALVRLDRGKCLPRWVAYFLISLAGKRQSYVFTSGGTKDGLELSDVKNLTVLLPSMDEQRHIIAEIDCDTGAIDVALHRARSQIDLIREYRSRLIEDVVTGKLDVRRVELPALDEDEMIGERDEGTEEEADEVAETEEIALADV